MTGHNKDFSSTLKSCIILLLLVVLVFQNLSPCVSAQAEKDEIVAGIPANYPPQYQVNTKTGKPYGFAIDVMDEVARRSGIKVRYVVYGNFSEVIVALRKGEIDVVPNLGITDERKNYTDFTTPFEASQIHIFLRSTTNVIQNIDDLTGRKVAVVSENQGYFIMKERGGSELLVYKSMEEALMSLISGNADAMVYPEEPLLRVARQSGIEDHIKTTQDALAEIKRAIGVRKGQPELYNKLDEAVKAFILTPEYETIYIKWYGKPEPYWNTQRVLAALGITISLVAVIFLIIHYFSVLRLNKKLRESENKYRKLHESIIDAFAVVDMQGRIKEINRAYIEMLGYTETELRNLNYVDLTPAKWHEFEAKIVEEQIIPKGYSGVYEKEYRRKDGTVFPVELRTFLIKDDAGNPSAMWAIVRDVTERKRTGEEILKLNRIYAVISQINQAIVRVHEKDKILSEACRIAVEYGKFQMAWIGMIDEKTRLVNPVASSGVEDGYLSKIKRISVEDVPEGRGPTGTAIREKRHYVCDDIEKDPRMAPWREEALKRGYRSSIALPIKPFGKVIGAFTLYASVPHFFDSEEIHLLDEVTNDISFALESIEIAKKNNEAEEALRKSEELFRTVLNNAPITIFAIDNQGVFTLSEGKSLEKVNLKPGENVGVSALDLFAALSVIQPNGETINGREVIQRVLAGETLTGITELRGVYFDNQFVPYRDAQGKIIGIIGVATIITERKRAEEQTLQQKEFLNNIFESLTHPFYVIDANNHGIVMANPAACMNRLTADSKCFELTHKRKISCSSEQICPLDEVKKTKKPVIVEHIHYNNDGDPRNVEVHGYPIFDKEGKVVQMIEYCLDITEHKQAEKEIKLLASIVKNIPDSVCTIGLDRNIITWNEGAEKMLGYKKEEILGKSIAITIPEYLARKELDHCIRVLNEDGFFTGYESVRITKDGRIIPVEIASVALKDEKQSITGYTSIIRDITDRKIAEETRLENDRLEYANKAKSEILAGMSHELRTPLNAIIGFSELMNMGLAGDLSEKQKKYVSNISTSGNFLLTLINDILDMSKIESGKIELNIEKTHIPTTIEEIAILIKEKALKHNIKIIKEIDPCIEFIEVDKQRLKQVLFNLLSNAVKFSKEGGGTITITTKKVDENVQISVSDTGIGIKPENLNKLFQKFEQLEKGISAKYGGTGLGLAISKQLVEMHGGKIWAQSKYGEGSTFTFTLPLKSYDNGGK